MLASVLWVLLCMAMWFWAVVGPFYAIAGVASYFVDLGDLFPLMPSSQAISVGAVLGFAGISFTWLRVRGHLKFEGERYDR